MKVFKGLVGNHSELVMIIDRRKSKICSVTVSDSAKGFQGEIQKLLFYLIIASPVLTQDVYSCFHVVHVQAPPLRPGIEYA